MPRGRPATSPTPREDTRTTALRLLGRRELTRAELTIRLLERGFTEAEVEPVVGALVADRTVDDTRTAEAHVRRASRVKGRGRLRIRRELEARGIDRETVQAALSQISAADDVEAIRRFLDRKRLPARPSRRDRQRLFQQLVRRGFRPEAISQALETDE
jgi:regulatory protein